jgi:hypothetical protein
LANNYGLGSGGLLLRRRRSAGLQRVGEAWLLTLVMAGDGGMLHRYLRLLMSPGYPRSRNLGSDDANTLCVVLPLGASFLQQMLYCGGRWLSGVRLPRQ